MPRDPYPGFTRMEGEILPSALTLANESGMGDPQLVHKYPEAKYLDEIRVLHFIQSVLDKPDWRTKMISEDIWEKWKDEALTQEPRFRDEMFEYARQELTWLSQSRDANTGVEPTGVDLVWRSDCLIPDKLRGRFLELINKFESNIPDEKRDWHPNSDEKVLNLIHPSMYCLAYGKSVDYCGKSIICPVPEREFVRYPELHEFHNDAQGFYEANQRWRRYQAGTFWSSKFQWLPAELLIETSGKVKIGSYINSLPPFGELNQGLYLAIAEIFEKAVPLLNVVLTDLQSHYTRNRFIGDGMYSWWPEGKPERSEELEEEQKAVYAMVDEWEVVEEAQAAFNRKEIEWFGRQEMNALPIQAFDEKEFVKVPLDEKREAEHGNVVIDLKGHQVQAIVKIGSIQLTPDKPSFEGGKWHVEGMANERIVATVIYYYDSENIEGDELMFRQGVNLDYTDGRWEQEDTEGAQLVFGIEGRGPMVQDAGRVKTPEGRVICFPNIYQHQVPPFSLADKTKPGHRKILVFFLVDPFVEGGITSTADVPPQEIEEPLWRNAELEESMRERLPAELVEMIERYFAHGEAKWGMTKEEALKNRLDLMAERSENHEFVDTQVFGRSFNLCEH